MAIDLRGKHTEYSKRNKYFKRIKGTQEHEEQPRGIFYSKEISPLTKTPLIVSGKVKGVKIEVGISTTDYIADLEVDDFVLYSNQLLRVEKIVIKEQPNNKFSTRPFVETELTLIN